MRTLLNMSCSLLLVCSCTPKKESVFKNINIENIIVKNCSLIAPEFSSSYYNKSIFYTAFLDKPRKTFFSKGLKAKLSLYLDDRYVSYPRCMIYIGSDKYSFFFAFPFMDEKDLNVKNYAHSQKCKIGERLSFASEGLKINSVVKNRLIIISALDSLLGMKQIVDSTQFIKQYESNGFRSSKRFLTEIHKFNNNIKNLNFLYFKPFKGRGGVWEFEINKDVNQPAITSRFIGKEEYKLLLM